METSEEQGRDDEAAETVPATEGGDPAEPPEETPAQPVDNPDLPEEGDPDDFYPEQVADEDFDDYADNNETMDNKETLEEPNDLSEIDKEFDDED